MRFSVLIPVYNVEKYLRQCLDSVTGQTFRDFEVIAVDDGSTDNCHEICDGYAKSFPDIFRVVHKPNEGLISARRTAVALARGEYCVFVDSDDFVGPDLLETLNGYLRDGNPDIVLYSYKYYDNSGKTKNAPLLFPDGKTWTGDEKKELYMTLLSSSAIDALWIKAIKTELLTNDTTDYAEYYKYNMSEDTLQSVFPLTAANRIKYCAQNQYYYRYNGESISRNFDPGTIEKKNTLHVYEKIREYLPVWGMDDPETAKRLDARWFSETMYIFFKSMEGAKSRRDVTAVLAADWNSMLPDKDVSSFAEYASPAYLKV